MSEYQHNSFEIPVPLAEEIPNAILDDLNTVVSSKRVVVSVDFGTTFSAISYVAVNSEEEAAKIGHDRISTIEHWPCATHTDANDRMRQEVPSEVIYPLDRKFRKGFDREFLEDQVDLDQISEDGLSPPSDNSYDSGSACDEDPPFSDTIDSFQWGYGVHDVWSRPITHSDENSKALNRFKLLFDNSITTKRVRDELEPALNSLKAKKVIHSHVDIVADYLACLLRHAKSELQKVGKYDDYEIEMVLCVPAIWSQKACRDMQVALTSAMRRANFRGVDLETNSIENLFLVSEPEAAAACVLELEPTIKVSESARRISLDDT